MKHVPTASSLLGVVIVVIFLLYFTAILKTIPCGNTLMTRFINNFIHVDIEHLVYNLYALFVLSRVEREVGTQVFVSIVVFSLIVNTVIETIVHSINSEIPCSIGFSGVIFSVLTWELIAKRKLDYHLLFVIAAMIILPALQDKKSSIVGHSIGALTGIIAGLMWVKIGPAIINSEKKYSP